MEPPRVHSAMQFKYPQFEESFRQMLKDAENMADLTKGSTQPVSRTKVIQDKTCNTQASVCF